MRTIRIVGTSHDRSMPSKAQLLDWLIRIQALGAEPIIQVSLNGKQAAAADMVKYFNLDSAKPILVALKEVDSTIRICGHDVCNYLNPAINDLFGGKNDFAGLIPGKT